MTNDHATAALGDKAKSELEATSAAFDELERAMFEMLVETGVGQTAKIERLHMGLQQLRAIQKALMQMVNNGLMARQAIALETGLGRPN